MYPLMEVDCIGPHISEWMISKNPSALLSLFEKGLLILFPCAHPFHTPSLSTLNSSRPVTALVTYGNAL
jgi:hypothetical protein